MWTRMMNVILFIRFINNLSQLNNCNKAMESVAKFVCVRMYTQRGS